MIDLRGLWRDIVSEKTKICVYSVCLSALVDCGYAWLAGDGMMTTRSRFIEVYCCVVTC